ncbi:hypothetical protein H5410_036865 [Solanum commersonii]|uniref:Uncharacterized protein n=1 Tax=Solanum commersonii TaxID=4109 RepID=A0A9J5Y5H6_SOLCO|nr:hypothetical protein H5410_036865 [Solanum commersonii]
MPQNTRMLKAKAEGDEPDQRADRRMCRRSQLIAPNDTPQPKFLNTINTFVFELNEIPVFIGSSWVQPKRVNPRPSPTLSARDSEWAKAEDVLKCGNSVFERN